ncbi:MAG: GntR family transcriptional regulator [Deltaproteobacteria bacterium]|nr:GntR family transcriptional regulator [Deltaproteobacteria bacterium]
MLKTRITNLDISMGQRLDVAALQAELGVSRAPIREALQKLGEGRLVDIKPRVGYFVLRLSRCDIKDIYDMRRLLETHALREAMGKIPVGKLSRLRDEILKLRGGVFSPEELRKRFDRTDHALHRELILGSCENRFLRDFAERLNNFVTIVKHLNQRIDQASEEHLRILEALMKGDLKEAEEELITHLNNAESKTLESLEV